jgi:hypothetical protein
MSPCGPSVWTGRALQAQSDDLEVVVLRFCIRPVNGTFVFPAIMDIRARSISFASRPRRPYGPPGHERAGETFFHLLIPTRRPRRESQLWLLGSARAVPSEPPSLARLDWRATGDGGHPLGEPERVHFRLLPL